MRKIKPRSKLRPQDDHATHDDAHALRLGRRQFLSGSAAFLGARSAARARAAPVSSVECA